jgi:hypothetical protein
MRAKRVPQTADDCKGSLPAAVDSAIISYLGRRFHVRPLVAIVIAQACGLGAR